MKSDGSGHLTQAEVLAKLDQGHELQLWRNTRHTNAGWGIDTDSVHGSTVNAMERKGLIKEVPTTGRTPYHIARIMVKV